jgi:CheY-like chemotaxis protein
MSKSTFFPTIPVDQVPLHELPTAYPRSLKREKHRPVVLVVDDERIIADTISLIFGHNDFAVMTAYDAPSALELATVIPPELLITDVMMPGMTGIDLAVAINQTVPDCEVIIFSGQATTTDLLATARKEGHEFTALSKPLHPTVLLAEAARRLHLQPANSKRPIPISGPAIQEFSLA